MLFENATCFANWEVIMAINETQNNCSALKVIIQVHAY